MNYCSAFSGSFWVRTLLLPLVCVALLATVGFPQQRLNAQQKYNPLHPEVEAMVRAGISFLEGDRQNIGSGQLCLNALAITEAYKRYEERIPRENPVVDRAVKRIAAEFEFPRSDSRHILNGEEIYYMCLASILLCEYDAELYKVQIQAIIDELVKRQQNFGAFTYLNKQGQGDASQSQFAGLALWVAKHNKFRMPLDCPKNCLKWYIDVMLPDGTWYYIYLGRDTGNNSAAKTMSIHAAAISTVYLFADLLQLNARRKKTGKAANSQWKNGLPPSVTLYIPPKDKEDSSFSDWNKEGPLVSFETGGLSRTKQAANKYFADNFKIGLRFWNYYYLYAMERYAYFREKSEGSFKEVPDWYDQGVDFLKTKQRNNGGFEPGGMSAENGDVSTSFAMLYLIRASELLILPPNASLARGGLGFQENQRYVLKAGGVVEAIDAVKGINDVMSMLKDTDLDSAQAEMITAALGQAVEDFRNKKNKSRNEQTAFLRGLMTDKNYFRRLVAVKVLTRAQDIDNAPALIYGLGDPDTRICREAHNGLRLISRKLKSITVPSNATTADYQVAKRLWSDWYLSIRPGAKLWD